jgi:hypothetical protein
MASLTTRQQIQWGIEFVTHGGTVSYLFEEPWQLSLWHPPRVAGLYAILVYDTNFEPRPYKAIYFGQSPDFSERGFPARHENYQDWLDTAKYSSLGMLGGPDLYIAIMRMPYSTEASRSKIEQELIEKYRPACNFRFNPLNGSLNSIARI